MCPVESWLKAVRERRTRSVGWRAGDRTAAGGRHRALSLATVPPISSSPPVVSDHLVTLDVRALIAAFYLLCVGVEVVDGAGRIIAAGTAGQGSEPVRIVCVEPDAAMRAAQG